MFKFGHNVSLLPSYQ